jgi:hypothetical protein
MAKPPDSPKCQHVLNTGRRCNAPAVHGLDFCHWHRVAKLAEQTKNPPIPLLDDGNSIQLALTLTLRGIQSGEISPKQGTAMLYGLSIASYNLKSVRTDYDFYASPETTPAMRPVLGLPPLPVPPLAPPAATRPVASASAECKDPGPAQALDRDRPAPSPTHFIDSSSPAAGPTETAEDTPACLISPSSDDPSGDPPKFPPAHFTITPADREKMRKIMRQGPSHPDFARCTQLLDAYISRKSGT